MSEAGTTIEQEPTFEELLNESLAHARVTLSRGERVRGRVVSIRGQEAIIDLGSKREALLDLTETTDQGEPLQVQVGDEVEGTIVNEGDEGEPARLTSQIPGGRLGRQYLAELKRQNLPVTGLVRGFNRGGLEIQIGALRAFCPMSQVDQRPPEDLSPFVGQRLPFRVHDLRGRQVVVSRRALLDEERTAKAMELIASLTEGEIVHGIVASLHDFGVFIDIGGLDALLPTSEITRRRMSRASELLHPGQELDVQVLKIEPAEGTRKRARITVSLKTLEVDPWEAAREWLVEGAAFRGKVVGIQPFGLFVELVPGVDGLIHVSELSGARRIENPDEVAQVGQELDVLVGPVDWENRRVALSPIHSAPTEEGAPAGTGEGEGTSASPSERSREGRPSGGFATTLGEALKGKNTSGE